MAAGKTVVPLGKYKGQTIDDVATTDDGLRYLDWLRGAMEYDPYRWRLWGGFLERLAAYLDDFAVAHDLEGLQP